jgi:hypothetical protein
MSSSISVLSKFSSAHLYVDPYPHIIIEDALDSDIAAALCMSFPSAEVLNLDNSRNNQRWSYPANEILRDSRLSELWRSVIRFHTSQDFWMQVRESFGVHLDLQISKELNTVCMSHDVRVGVRGEATFESHDILLEAQISGNTPVTFPTSVRSTHLDEGNKIFSGLYYLRDEDDDSRGGELLLQRWRTWIPNQLKPHLYFEGMKDVAKTVKRVPYRHNTLVIILNSLDALHAVSMRYPTTSTRKFINLDGVLPLHEYQLPKLNPLARLRRKLT